MIEGQEPKRVALINLSGPYGVGKDSVLSELLASFGDGACRVRTLTTRPASQDSDPSYTSVSPCQFERIVRGGRWLVNTQLDGQVNYATSIDEIERLAQMGRLAAASLFAGPEGAGRLREVFGSRLLSFGLLATGQDDATEKLELENRLRRRGRENAAVLAGRLAHQAEKIAYVKINPVVTTPDGPLRVFDYIIVNARLAEAAAEVIRDVRSRVGFEGG